MPVGTASPDRLSVCQDAAAAVCAQRETLLNDVQSCGGPRHAYVRAIFVNQSGALVPERVSTAESVECGAPLRHWLSTRLDGAPQASIPCWVTVLMSDSCILGHAAFAISPSGGTPVNYTNSLTAVSTASRGCATPGGSVRTPREEILTPVTPSGYSAAGQPPLQYSVTTPRAAPGSSHYNYPREDARRERHQAVSPRGPVPTTKTDDRRVSEPEGQRRGTATPRSEELGTTLSQHAAGSSANASRPRNASGRGSPLGSAAQRQTNTLVISEDRSPQAVLVTPWEGQQWPDWAYRTPYAPRREELWKIADSVITQWHGVDDEDTAYLEDHRSTDRSSRGI